MLNHALAGMSADEHPLTHLAELPARRATSVGWPTWVSPTVARAMIDSGVHSPWSHQVAAASLAASGCHVIVATGTASGKSLAYQMPVLTTVADDRSATAIYLAPTKALGADQLRSVVNITEAAGLDDVFPAAYDGDASDEARQWCRQHSRWVFTNPDMLHLSILGSHERWGRLLRHLRFVVVDECHHYRGVFGSQVALVLRRLRRVAARHGADPVFVLASATTANPAAVASRLIGVQCAAITEDGSPRAARTIALWEPPLRRTGSGAKRRSVEAEAARILARLVAARARTLTFVASRYGAELTALTARRLLADQAPELVDRVAAYRSGYLAEDRRALELALAEGELLGVATTNALELGVDINGLDAVVLAGFPGTVASFWQRAGRAGRDGVGSSLVVLVARDDPLDTYLVHHPAALLDKPVEATVIDPRNPVLLGPQLLCAAVELPLTDAEVHEFGGWEPLTELASLGLIRRRAHGWFVPPDVDPYAEVDLRGGSGGRLAVVESGTGRLLGTSDGDRAPATLYPGAIHLHRGESFVVDTLDLDAGIALVHAETPDWTTSAREVTAIEIVGEPVRLGAADSGVTTALVHVAVTRQVVGYARTLLSGELVDVVELEMPARTLSTRAVLYTLTPELLASAGVSASRVPGALHAAEHAAIGLLPLVAGCDRWDVGGVSTASHPDTGLPSVFVYDGHAGGAGFADRGFAELVGWLTATKEAIESCECAAGCPSCVYSPKCGNGNSPLDKAGAIAVLTVLIQRI